MNHYYSIGYYRDNEWGDSIIDLISDYPEIREVYFPLPSQRSGRYALDLNANTDEVESQLKRDLIAISKRGLKLNLLLNAGCYADKVKDKDFIVNLKHQLTYYVEILGVTSITTTLPAFAMMAKKMFGDAIETRASVNMGIASIDVMNYLNDEFDAFYPSRELYRSIDELPKWREWADKHDKRLYALVNSGCLANCPWHTIDNSLVAHGVVDFKLGDGTKIQMCDALISRSRNITPILKSVFIRPEDVHNYEPYFDGFKIATRNHFMPRLVVRAYMKEHFEGLITDLLEPGHTYNLKPEKCVPNSSFPSEWFIQTSNCHRNCSSCNYCEHLAQRISTEYSANFDFWHFLFDDEQILKERLAARGFKNQ